MSALLMLMLIAIGIYGAWYPSRETDAEAHFEELTAERGRDSAQARPIDVAYWAKQLARLNPIRLCPIVPGEGAPYSSCARR